jgi:eukaryotic-like serine/threonine-protein kinase
VDGGVPREIADHVAEADWAPDGTLAIIRESGRRRIEFPPGHVLYESGGRISALRVSPGGDRVAFIEIGSTQHRVSNIATEAAGSVVVMDRQGQRTVLSTGWTSIGGLAWAPDGREVWFTATKSGISQALHAVTLTGRERLVVRGGGILWLHDIFRDGRVLLTQGRASIEARGRMGKDTIEREYSWLDGTLGAIFSPDGRSFTFSEAADGGGPASGAYLRKADGSPPVRLGDGWALSISPDGKWVVCSNIGLPRELRLVPTGAGEPRKLRRGTISEYDWAYFLPDGKRLVVAGSEAGRPPRLFVQELPDGEPQAFTPEGTGLEPLPAAITPDGRFVAAAPIVGERRFALYPVGGGAPQPIPGIGAGDTPLRFSPDGASVYVLEPSGPGNRVVRLNLATGRKTPWLDLAPPDAAGFWGSTSFVDIAPDGRSYLYSYWRIVSDLFVVEGLR